jgi:hypothetical protein
MGSLSRDKSAAATAAADARSPVIGEALDVQLRSLYVHFAVLLPVS